MTAQSPTTRGVRFAYLFGPPRFLGRDEASGIHGAICDALRLDDLAFQYSSDEKTKPPAARGFAVELRRKEGRGGFAVSVNMGGLSSPMRCLITWDWPPSLEHVKQQFDKTASALFGQLEGPWQKIVAEVRLRSHCGVPEATALGFITGHMLRLSSDWLESLGKPLVFGSVQLQVAPSHDPEQPLQGPRRELTVEVLREDPRSLYLELMSQWPHMPAPTELGAEFNVGKIRPILDKPSDYVEEAWAFLDSRLAALKAQAGETP